MTYQDKYNKITDAIRTKADEIMPKGSRVVLYGSRARGDFKEDSDWDIHILIHSNERLTLNDMDYFAYPLEKIGWEFDEFISATIYSDKDWEARKANPFYENVERDKVIILSK